MHQGLVVTPKQQYTCPGKQSVFWNEDLVILWLLNKVLCHLFEHFSCTAVETCVYTCAYEPPSSLPSCISQHLCGNICVCAGKLHGFIRARQSPLQNTNSPRNSSCIPSHTSEGHALASASKDTGAEMISIIWLHWDNLVWKQDVPALRNSQRRQFLCYFLLFLCFWSWYLCFLAWCPKKIVLPLLSCLAAGKSVCRLNFPCFIKFIGAS